jgi:hypothetical protein
MISLPGRPCDIPLPPDLCEAFGYRGDARFVGFHGWPGSGKVVIDDGISSSTANGWVFADFRRHRAVAPLLHGIELGFTTLKDADCLVIDRQQNCARIVPLAEVKSFLLAQHPEPPPLTDEQREAIQNHFDDLAAQGWREVRVDPGEVMKAMQEQRGRVGRMMSFLDRCPVPPE